MIIVNKNSFISLEDADAYFDERFDSKEWLDADEEVKEQLLITATKKINMFDFIGEKNEVSQPLEFPRKFGTPQDIKDAVCEEAISLLKDETNVHKKNQEDNISSISLGVGSVSYNTSKSDSGVTVLVSKIACRLVQKWVKKGFSIV